MANETYAVQKCFLRGACIGEGKCHSSFEGKLCNECIKNYVKNNDGICGDCNTTESILIFFGYLFIFLGYFFCKVYLSIPAVLKQKHISGLATNIILKHVQIFFLILLLSKGISNNVDLVTSKFSNFFYSFIDLKSLECIM
jgi:hypothetical protein